MTVIAGIEKVGSSSRFEPAMSAVENNARSPGAIA